jgi:hypothetical protein
MENDRDEIVQKLFNMMSMSHDMSYSHSYASEYAQSKDFGNRCNAVRWMKEVTVISVVFFLSLGANQLFINSGG